MIYVDKIELIGNTYPSAVNLKTGLEIECSHVNLFVGNQGTGKSTYLKLMQQNHKDLKISLSEYTLKNGVNTFYFDTEKDNPRVNDLQKYSSPSGENVGIGVGGALSCFFQSHGEVISDFVLNPLLNSKDCVIFIDEPESGLSITNQFKLINAIETAVNNGCQLFIATHCYPLIEKFNVISLEHNEIMCGKEFIERVKSNI